MNVKDAIEKRRAYRVLEPVIITDETISLLGKAAQFAPSCFNNQPWRFIFIRDKKKLEDLFPALPPNNTWVKEASLIIAAFADKKNDCIIKEREFYLFDLGLACQSIILQATELELVAHPIAGFSPVKAKEILGIPDHYNLLTLIIIGKKLEKYPEPYSEEQQKKEINRPQRRKIEQIISIDKYKQALEL